MQKLTERIDRIIEQGIQSGEIPGAGVAIAKRGSILHRKAYGLADCAAGTPMQTDTLMRFFSMTKPVTAAVTMMLVEEGRLDVTDPVWWYFPAFKDAMVLGEKGLVPAERPVTIHDLLTMTAGYPYPGGGNASIDCVNRFFEEIDRRNDTDHPVTTQEFAERIGAEVPAQFQPGAKWDYGICADLIGAILEKAADMPLDMLYEEKIFAPLGMKDTGFYVPAEKRTRLAALYTWGEQGLVPEPDPHLGMTDYRAKPAFCSAGAGLVSTLDDYLQFAVMLANRGTTPEGMPLMSAHTWRTLTAPHLTPAQADSILWPQLRGYSYGYLMRVLTDPSINRTTVPAGEFGWDGWTGPYFMAVPEECLTMVYAIQVCNGSNSRIVRLLRAAAMGLV